MEYDAGRARERRERIRRNMGLNYLDSQRSRGRCWVCHHNPAWFAPVNAQEYAIWRRRGLKICCTRRRCIDRAFESVGLCDNFKYCRRAAWWDPGDDYKRELLRQRNIVRCDHCEMFSFDDPLEGETLCDVCGRDADLKEFVNSIENTAFDVCSSCYKKLQRAFAEKYLNFDDE